MAASSFNTAVEKAWESLPLPEQVTLPWEKEHWNGIFGETLQSVSNPVVAFKRPIVLFPGMTRDETVARQAKLPRVIKPRDYSARWMDFIRPGNDLDWKDKRESDLQVAIKRWYDIVQSFPPSVGIRILLDQQPTLTLKLKMIKNLLWNKALATLVKRANSMSRFVEYRKQIFMTS